VTIKIFFTDFWPGFNPEDNYFINLLRKHYNIILSEHDPDYLFFSVFGYNHFKFKCKKIFFTGENIRPDLSLCDYSFTFDFDTYHGRNYRLPLYVQYDDVNQLTFKKDPSKILSEKTEFCNFVYSNPDCKKRINFFKKLSKYKKVDSGGRILNNIGSLVSNKREFLKKYKFTIAFENGEFPGYTTEKIFEPMLSDSIPLYWGNPLVGRDFNSKSFLNYYDYGNDDDFIDRIIEVDRNDDLYKQILNEPYFSDNKVNEFADERNILNKFDEIFNSNVQPIYLSSPAYSNIGIIKQLYIFSRRLRNYLFYMKKNLKTLSVLKIRIKLKQCKEL